MMKGIPGLAGMGMGREEGQEGASQGRSADPQRLTAADEAATNSTDERRQTFEWP